MIEILILFSVIADSTGCFLCHSEVRSKYKLSIHYSENVLCSDCHGGNETALDIKKAHSGNFRGKFTKMDVIEVCSKCHSSAEKMAPYGIPFDQKELYMMSAHGKLLLRNKNVPVCSDCHGYHEVYKSQDKESSVNRLKVPYLCGNCHKDEFEDYAQSIHFEYVKKGNGNSPTCVDCHGSHGAYPPGFRDIDKICGKCHIQARENFLKSPHYKPFIEMGLKECEACHDNHKVKQAGITLWDGKCTSCHNEKEEAFKVKEEIKSLLIETENAYKFAEEWISKIEKIPLETEDLINRLKDARRGIEDEKGVLHTLDVERIKEIINQYKGVYDDVAHEAINKYKLFQTRYLLIPVLWFLIIVTIFLIQEYRKRMTKSEE